MIKDSGCRREFETGAVRDIQEGKGRCDLLPLFEVSDLMDDAFLECIAKFQQYGQVSDLFIAVESVAIKAFGTLPNAMLELSKHFEEGAKKYGEYNWQKGLPESSYIDSAVRHYLKWLDGIKDEPHDRAILWNLMCLAWTVHNCTKEVPLSFIPEGTPTLLMECNNCAYYVSEPESQLFQKCLKDKENMTRSPSHCCEDWKLKKG